jgi:L-alanine-DL-glutamate epimerase-like enolase superfamily enzyme
MDKQKSGLHSQTECSRRSLLKAGGLGGLSLATVLGASVEQQIARATQNIRRSSSPSQLRITDLRIAVVTRAPFRCPLIRIDTNQGVSGYGEVRDGGSERYALMLKSRLLGQNPCNVERIFQRIKQFGNHGRQGGGVSGVEMALWDLAGKAYGVPVYQMLGGRYRDRVRLYADTSDGNIRGLKKRLDQGFTFLKMDCGIRSISRVPGALSYPTKDTNWRGKHPFTGIQLSDKGAALMAKSFADAREAVGWEVPIAADHFGHIGVNSCIKLGKALQPYQPAWLEDMVPWEYADMLKEIKNAVDVPLLTGEDIYLLDGFKPLIDEHAVDMKTSLPWSTTRLISTGGRIW